MMKIIPVLLLSRQTLPNVLFLKELMQKEVELQQIIMITTLKMREEGRGKWILKAAGIDVEKVEVRWLRIAAEDYRQAKTDLQKKQHDPEGFYYVNLTCGTKMMSMAVNDYYSSFANCRCYYMPIGGE